MDNRNIKQEYGSDLGESVIAAVLNNFKDNPMQARNTLEAMKQPNNPVYNNYNVQGEPTDEELQQIIDASKREAEEQERRRKFREEEELKQILQISERETYEKQKQIEDEINALKLQTIKTKEEMARREAEQEENLKRYQKEKDEEQVAKRIEKLKKEAELREAELKKKEIEMNYELQRKELQLQAELREAELKKQELETHQEIAQREANIQREVEKRDIELKKKEAEMAELLANEKQKQLEAEINDIRQQTKKMQEKAVLEENEMKKREAELKKREEQLAAAQFEGPPRASIYCKKDEKENNPDECLQTIERIKATLANFGISRPEIQELEVTQDFELQEWIEQEIEGPLQYPIVFIHSKPIGSVETLEKYVDEDKLKGIIEKAQSDSTGIMSSELGILDNVLNGTEYILSGVGSVLMLPVTILTWPFRSNAEKTEKPDKDIDIEIIHTNWYWRHLVRVFRFSETGVIRVHPKHGDARAMHSYASFESVTIVDEENLVFKYTDSPPDYIQATKENVVRIIDILKTRAPKNLPIEKQKM